jgi:hypothetical protein
MDYLRRLLHSLAAPLLLLGLALVFCWELLSPAPGEGWWGLDANLLFYPFGHYVAEAFREGRLALWNPFLFLGFPMIAEPQAAAFYPVTWLYRYWPVERVIGWSLVLHLWVAAAGMYAFLRRIEAHKSGALLSGVLYGFSSFVTARIYAGHFAHLTTAAWTPWMLAAFH